MDTLFYQLLSFLPYIVEDQDQIRGREQAFGGCEEAARRQMRFIRYGY
jgi:hypothetical protein